MCPAGGLCLLLLLLAAAASADPGTTTGLFLNVVSFFVCVWIVFLCFLGAGWVALLGVFHVGGPTQSRPASFTVNQQD